MIEKYRGDWGPTRYLIIFSKRVGKDRWNAVTFLCPTSARRFFPCWDEPSLKATFSIELVIPDELIGLSNMVRIHWLIRLNEFFFYRIFAGWMGTSDMLGWHNSKQQTQGVVSLAGTNRLTKQLSTLHSKYQAVSWLFRTWWATPCVSFFPPFFIFLNHDYKKFISIKQVFVWTFSVSHTFLQFP